MKPLTNVGHIRLLPKTMLFAFGPLCLVLFAAGWISHHAAEVRAKANSLPSRMTAAQATERGLTLCGAFSSAPHLLERPSLHVECYQKSDASLAHRKVWQMTCEADGQHYFVKINDRTGNLIGMFQQTPLITDATARLHARLIATPTTAVQVALNQLRQMQLLSPETHLRLQGTPVSLYGNNAWDIRWIVRQPGTPQPFIVKQIINRHDGFPIVMLDYRESEILKTL